MMNKRFKNVDWDLANPQGTIASWTNVQIAVLMDIRDELQRLNRILGCHNFLDVPFKLDRIEKNTRKPLPRKKKA